MKTPFAYSMVPIAPSHTSTRSSRASRKGFSIPVRVSLSCVEPFGLECRRVDQQVRFRDDVEADRADALAHRIRELVVMSEQMQARLHCREHVVQHGLAGIDAPARRVK